VFNLLSVVSSSGQYQAAVAAYDTASNESGLSNVVSFTLDQPVGPEWCSEEFKLRVKQGIDFVMRYNGVWNLERYREYLEGRMMLRICP
jgi:hypothetical protein